MMMSKQTRILIVLMTMVGLIGLYIASKSFSEKPGQSEQLGIGHEEVLDIPEAPQEKMGDPVGSAPAVQEESEPEESSQEETVTEEDRKNFSLIATDLLDCFDVHSDALPEELPLQMESILTPLQKAMGPTNARQDRWMNWNLTMKDGTEKRLRLEVNSLDEGMNTKELKYYAVDSEGLPVPIEIEEANRFNPSDEVLNQMLNEGEVTSKERAASATFVNGATVDYIETDGVLSEFEFQNNNRYFRCQNLKNRDGCQCIR